MKKLQPFEKTFFLIQDEFVFSYFIFVLPNMFNFFLMYYNISAKKAVKIHQINSCLLVLLIPLFSLAQISTKKSTRDTPLNINTAENFTITSQQLSLKEAFQITGKHD